MTVHVRWRALGVVAWVVGLLGSAGTIRATTFSYQVERFELDGNVRGPSDGTPDFVDEFDDGSIAPGWYRAYGTIAEHDGFLFITNPGAILPDPNGQTLEISIAASATPYLQDGAGSFLATAYWLPLLPPAGHHYHFSIYTFSGTPYFNEIVGLGFLGLGDGNYAIEQHLTELDINAGIYQDLISVQHPIDASQISGNLGMRLAFDDATNMVTTSFSLDGGATWESPFDPAPIFDGRNMAQLILSADPVSDGVVETTTTTTATTSSTTTTITLPPTACVATGCRRGALPGRSTLAVRPRSHRLSWKWARGATTRISEYGNPAATTAYDVCIADGTGTTLYHAILAPGSSWRMGARMHRYHTRGNTSLVLLAGDATRANISLSVKDPSTSTLAPPLGLPMTVRLRSSDGRCWANEFPSANVNRSELFRAHGD